MSRWLVALSESICRTYSTMTALTVASSFFSSAMRRALVALVIRSSSRRSCTRCCSRERRSWRESFWMLMFWYPSNWMARSSYSSCSSDFSYSMSSTTSFISWRCRKLRKMSAAIPRMRMMMMGITTFLFIISQELAISGAKLAFFFEMCKCLGVYCYYFGCILGGLGD